MAVDMLGKLLALHVTAANEQDRAQVGVLAEAVQAVTGQNVEELAIVDQCYTGDAAAEAAQAHGIRLQVIKHPKPNAASCCAAAALGGGTQLRLAGTLSALGA